MADIGLAGEVARLFASGLRMPEKLASFGTLPLTQLSGFAAHLGHELAASG